MTKPIRLVVSNANPLAMVERLPGWWRGKAKTRLWFAESATSDKEADEHLRAASEYESRLLEIVESEPDLARRVRAAGEIA